MINEENFMKQKNIIHEMNSKIQNQNIGMRMGNRK